MSTHQSLVKAHLGISGAFVNVAGGQAAGAETKEAMPRNPAFLWNDPSYADETLARLTKEYAIDLSVRRKSPETVRAYRHALTNLARHLEKSGEPPTLGSLTPTNVIGWVKSLQDAGKATNTVAVWLAAVKAFTRGYVCTQLELTTDDLLRTVKRLTPEEPPIPRLTDDDMDAVLGSCGVAYDGVRNRAFVYCLLSTGSRFKEILGMTRSGLDLISGEFMVRAKGGRDLPKRMNARSLKAVKAYLAVRPRARSDALWLRGDGEPLSYWGGQEAMRKVRRESGIDRFHAHLCRHTFGQHAIEEGATPARVQDMLGHVSDRMTRRYTRLAREQAAAGDMPRYSPV